MVVALAFRRKRRFNVSATVNRSYLRTRRTLRKGRRIRFLSATYPPPVYAIVSGVERDATYARFPEINTEPAEYWIGLISLNL
jgi:hypothetical protein